MSARDRRFWTPRSARTVNGRVLVRSKPPNHRYLMTKRPVYSFSKHSWHTVSYYKIWHHFSEKGLHLKNAGNIPDFHCRKFLSDPCDNISQMFLHCVEKSEDFANSSYRNFLRNSLQIAQSDHNFDNISCSWPIHYYRTLLLAVSTRGAYIYTIYCKCNFDIRT